ncbi:deoxyribose-phosphate aldolase [uncultured Legionella sp.]|uniref:deoxyribose-phosphate aldolase n=1 Tax=uncultured Legionella sp. TaxID=210934 RepID=UPI0026043F32|nr:deoxyribose-phosphate aldolase [uncultured Legionella sp.]
MTFETNLTTILEQLLSYPSIDAVSKEQLIPTLDLTLLESDASDESLALLNNRAKAHRVAAVCIFPQYLPYFHRSSILHVATVVNFPHGANELIQSLTEIDNAIQSGANEIDFVFPYQIYLGGEKQKALNQCDVVIQACKKHEVTIKIIIETGAFSDIEKIYHISNELIAIGCDFIKTSTGKIPQGASLPAVFAILSALKEHPDTTCGIKISGGVKTTKQAQDYAHLAELMLGKKINKQWFRIGASSLLNELLNSK